MTKSRVTVILDAQRRVSDAFSLLERLDVSDPRWDGAYAEWKAALAARTKAES